MRKETLQRVIVRWKDAWQDQENFTTAHGIRSTHEPMIVETEGRLIQDDGEGISVVNEKSEQDGHDVFRGRTFIPRAMIESVTTYRLVKVKPKVPKLPNLPPETPKAPEA